MDSKITEKLIKAGISADKVKIVHSLNDGWGVVIKTPTIGLGRKLKKLKIKKFAKNE